MAIQLSDSAISVGGVIPSTSEQVLYSTDTGSVWAPRTTYEGASWGVGPYYEPFLKATIYAKNSNSVRFTSSDWGTQYQTYFIDIDAIKGTASSLQVRLLSSTSPSLVPISMNWKYLATSEGNASINNSSSAFNFLPISASGGSCGTFTLFNLNESSAKHILVGCDCMGFDSDPLATRATRSRFLLGCSQSPSAINGIEFSSPTGTFSGKFTLYSVIPK